MSLSLRLFTLPIPLSLTLQLSLVMKIPYTVHNIKDYQIQVLILLVLIVLGNILWCISVMARQYELQSYHTEHRTATDVVTSFLYYYTTYSFCFFRKDKERGNTSAKSATDRMCLYSYHQTLQRKLPSHCLTKTVKQKSIIILQFLLLSTLFNQVIVFCMFDSTNLFLSSTKINSQCKAGLPPLQVLNLNHRFVIPTSQHCNTGVGSGDLVWGADS